MVIKPSQAACASSRHKGNTILGLKRVKKFTGMEKMCREALRQIEGRYYGREPAGERYPLILKYGICFSRKSCMVKTGRNKS